MTAQISNKAQRGLRFLHEQANASVDELEFICRINLPLFSNRENKEFLDDIKECIVFAKGSDPTDYELWGFCKAFVLLLFDMDCVESINRALSYSLIKCNSGENALHVWARFLDYVSSCNQTASTIDQSNIDRNIQDGPRIFDDEENRKKLIKKGAEIAANAVIKKMMPVQA